MNGNHANHKLKVSKLATFIFLACAALLLYTLFQVFGVFVQSELRAPVESTPNVHLENPPESTNTAIEESADPVVSIITPVPKEAPTPGMPTPEAPVSAIDLKTPYDTGEIKEASIDEKAANVMILTRDPNNKFDMICLLSLKDKQGSLVGLPKNLLAAHTTTLSDLKTIEELTEAIADLLGIRYEYYAVIEQSAVEACVDAIGGISYNGELLDGKKANLVMKSEGRDELLRTESQLNVIKGFLERAQRFSFVKMIGIKNAIKGKVESNINTEKGSQLYRALVQTKVESYDALIPPIDSVNVNCTRCYELDEKNLEKFLQEVEKNR